MRNVIIANVAAGRRGVVVFDSAPRDGWDYEYDPSQPQQNAPDEAVANGVIAPKDDHVVADCSDGGHREGGGEKAGGFDHPPRSA